ncbi:MAG: carbamate kinase [Nitrospirota bacterium]
MPEPLLVALGGNALVRPGQAGSIPEQAATLRASLHGVVELIRRGHPLVITHGNGPQVGHILIRAEAARGQAYDLPLDVCVAQSQGETGYLIQQTLHNLLRDSGIDRPVVALISRVVVDKDDPRMQRPTKPIGPFYASDQAAALKARGFTMVEDAHRGYRRVVPSPLPVRIVETDIVKRLVEDGTILIVLGGGGIPVFVDGAGQATGVDAVVDKDLASSLLAATIGVTRILDLTSVDHVKLRFGTPAEQNLGRITLADAKAYLAAGHFAPGSMEPKIQAAIQFLEHGGRQVVITSPEHALAGFEGRVGTQIRPR